jgi:hypothetical protein
VDVRVPTAATNSATSEVDVRVPLPDELCEFGVGGLNAFVGLPPLLFRRFSISGVSLPENGWFQW